jgi:anti-sigma B factor antagonist
VQEILQRGGLRAVMQTTLLLPCAARGPRLAAGREKTMARSALALIADDRQDGPPVVSVRGELDVGNARTLNEWLEAASERGARSVLVDLSACTFIAGAALHVLCDQQERLMAAGQTLTVVCDKPELLKLFALVELQGVLSIVPDRRAARERAGQVRPNAHLADWVARHPPSDDGGGGAA